MYFGSSAFGWIQLDLATKSLVNYQGQRQGAGSSPEGKKWRELADNRCLLNVLDFRAGICRKGSVCAPYGCMLYPEEERELNSPGRTVAVRGRNCTENYLFALAPIGKACTDT